MTSGLPTLTPGAGRTSRFVLCSSEFPKESSVKSFRLLHLQSKKSNFPVLTRFLTECETVLRAEAWKLPRLCPADRPEFHSLLGLATDVLGETGYPVKSQQIPFEAALLCAFQISLIIGNFEAEGTEYDPRQDDAAVLARSAGLFAAAAISVSKSLTELAHIGPELVRAAFRCYAHIHQMSQLVEPRPMQESDHVWAYVVTQVGETMVQDEINIYNTQRTSSALTKIQIIQTDKDSVTVAGPPSRLNELFRSSIALRHLHRYPLKLSNGLCHRAGVYGKKDVKEITEALDHNRCRNSLPHIPLLSPSTGAPLSASNLTELIELVCEEVLTKPHNHANLIKGICSLKFNSRTQRCKLLFHGACFVQDQVISDLKCQYPAIDFIPLDLVEWITKNTSTQGTSVADKSKLAVVGMSCRMPGGANSPELLFQLLADGRDVHKRVPSDRFNVETHYDPTGKIENASETPYGNFIDKPGFFDAGFFNISPREAEQTDPMHRLALVTAYEALEMAGFSPNRTLSTNLKRVGTFYGVASDDYREVNAGQKIDTYATPGGERAFANGRINYFFKFGGPSLNIDTACSSSGAAINAACSALWAGDVDMALAGGLNVITNPDNYCMLSKGHFLSKTGQCKVWSKDADGYCRADGIGCIVIKRLEDAEAENDNIIATILAAATNHSANAISITHPHVGAQKDNYNQVLQQAGVSPLDVSYVELHGTGTQAGDAVESASVADVFAPLSIPRSENNPLYLGAIKSNVGHAEAAAGVGSLIKVLLAFQHETIPRNIGMGNEINPTVAANIRNRNIHMVTENTPWLKKPEGKRFAVANSFGAHGGNTTFLLEEAPTKAKDVKDPRTAYVIALSAKSANSLRGNISSLLKFLDQNSDVKLKDLSYTLCARRLHFQRRIATSVIEISELKTFLESFQNIETLRPVSLEPPPIAFVFTGQSTFYQGIGLQLFSDFPPFKDEVLRLDHISQQHGFSSILPFISNSTASQESSPLITQLTILLIELALVSFLELLGIKPNVVIGHSLGEYAALVCAGVLSAADAIFLVGKRAEIILATCEMGSHCMLSVRAGVETIKKLADGLEYSISCLNSASDTVISGSREQMEAIQKLVQQSGLKCIRLELPFAFHSPHMDPMLDQFENVAMSVKFNPPKIPVISPLLARCVQDDQTINANYLRRSAREPMNFLAGLIASRSTGITDDSFSWIEIGPHPVCRSFIRNHFPAEKIFSTLCRTENNFLTIAKTLAGLHCEGAPIIWNEYFRPYEKAYDLLNLPHYHWNEKNYWIPYEGTWTLDKAHQKKVSPPKSSSILFSATPQYPMESSSVHQIITDEISGPKRRLVTISDILHPDLRAAISSLRIKGAEVATTSIWVDIAFTIGDYLRQGSALGTDNISMDLSELEVFHSTIADKDKSKAQLIQVEASLDLNLKNAVIQWFKISADGQRFLKPFASATILYRNPGLWTRDWRIFEYFVKDRIDKLSQMVIDGTANKLKKSMVYSLFKNIVEYDDLYQGISSVVHAGYEAIADVTLNSDQHGKWFAPPHFTETVLQVAGFIMNCSDLFDHREIFAVTPGWASLRFTRRLKPGDRLLCYVKIASATDSRDYFGDVIVTQAGTIIGICTQMKYKRVPRILLDKFFGANDTKTSNAGNAHHGRPPTPFPKDVSRPITPTDSESSESPILTPQNFPLTVQDPQRTAKVAQITSDPNDNQLLEDSLKLIAREIGLKDEILSDNATFAELGVDSLMSLVLVQKLCDELRIEIHNSIFMECPSVKTFKDYLKEYY